MGYLDPAAGHARESGIKVKEMVFTEEGAGVYTDSVTLPAGAFILDIQVHAVALWAAGTSATLIVGDDDPDGFYTGVNLKATDLLAGQALTFAQQGGKAGAYLISTHVTNAYDAAAREITASVTSVGAGAAGETHVLVLYTVASDESTAAFVAA